MPGILALILVMSLETLNNGFAFAVAQLPYYALGLSVAFAIKALWTALKMPKAG